MEVVACRWGQEENSRRRWRRGTGTGEVGIADGDGDGRVNVLALALGHGELRPTTQGSSLLCTERAGERNVQGGGRAGGRGPTREEARRREDSRWKADKRRRYGKGENEMKSVFSGSSSRVRARVHDVH